ncbi:PDZ domain-containing protein 11-like [Liolophura sinensis]|uniref:PDZ domain-containing protein 11-like n=1 Tax=Liolophura sinensis TaxID=3198878 RepID=UPI00315806FD
MSFDGHEAPAYIEAQLPPYEPPPLWIPPEQRKNNPDYNNDLTMFLPRTVLLQRHSQADQLGFNIRGGKEHHCGIYISKVTHSVAARLGLKEGDQILAVNNISFENIDHAYAVKTLKTITDVQMTVRYFPYGYDRTYDKTRFIAAMQNSGRR